MHFGFTQRLHKGKGGLKICKGMSSFDENRKAKEERKEKDKLSRENLGKFFYDLAKLVFASMVIASGVSLILNESSVSYIALLITGLIFTYILAYIGYYIFKK